MKTHLLLGGGSVKAEVFGGDLVFEGTDHMITAFTKLRDKRLQTVKLYLAGGLELKLERSDGWEITIKEEAGSSQQLVITRNHSGNDRKRQRQYLAENMKWLPFPRDDSALPVNALRLPIFAP